MSLLAHLAAKFNKQNEVVATEALHFVLRRSATARAALERLLLEAGTGARVEHVAPQYVAGPESRPDLACLASDGRVSAFVEVKFWAGLTDAQPVEYLRRLAEQEGRCLCFVVPEQRVGQVYEKVAARAAAADRRLDHQLTSLSLRSGIDPAGLAVAVVSWRRLLSSLTAAVATGDHAASGDLAQLEGLVARYEADGFGTLSGEELTDLSVPRRAIALAQLIKALVGAARDAGVVSLGNLRETHGWTSAGRYLSLLHGNAWLGVDHEAWALYQESPLWLWFPNSTWGQAREAWRALEPMNAEGRRAFLNPDDSVSVALTLQAGVEPDDQLRGLVDQLRRIDRLLETAGLRRPEADAPQES